MRLLSVIILLFLQLTADAQTPWYVPTDSLMGWWPFNNNAMDESMHTNDGTVNGPVITSDVAGNPNAAYDFDGNDGITIPSLNLSSGNEMSISVWVNPNDLSDSYQEIVRQDNGFTGAPDFLLSFQSSGSILSFGVGTSAGYSELDFSISPAGFLNTWTHIVVVYDGAQRRIYRNATLIASNGKTGNINYTASTMTVGCEPTYTQPQEFFEGKIDDIGIWRRALAEQEIYTLYTGGLMAGVNESGHKDLLFYPNPSAGELFFVGNGECVRLEICNLLGETLSEYPANAGSNKIDLGGLSAGGYILRLYNKNNKLMKAEKLILAN